MTPEGSVSFDRAAGYYDATRALPPEMHRAMCDLLAGELRGLGRCLEIGVGTGRVGLSLADAGLDLVGIDISTAMLERLREKAPDGRPSLAVADATRLPFGDGSFGAALGVHVLHLVPGWRDAVQELARVVRPGGMLLFDVGSADSARRGGSQGPAREIELVFRAAAGIERRNRGLQSIADLDAACADARATPRDLPPITGSMNLAPAALLRLIEGGAYSYTWEMDPQDRERAAGAARAWAAGRYGDLDTPRPMAVVLAFRAYDLAT